jgi:hypothetical protein
MGHGGSARWEKEDAQAGTKMNLFYTRYKTTTYNTYGIRCDTEEDGHRGSGRWETEDAQAGTKRICSTQDIRQVLLPK